MLGRSKSIKKSQDNSDKDSKSKSQSRKQTKTWESSTQDLEGQDTKTQFKSKDEIQTLNIQEVEKDTIILPNFQESISQFMMDQPTQNFNVIQVQNGQTQIEDNVKQFEEHKSVDLCKQILELKDIEHKENDFLCAICLNYIVSAVTTKCGHTFCEICLQEYLLYIKYCPLCPENLRKTKSGQCLLLDQMIHDFLRNSHEDEMDFYKLRQVEAKQWKLNQQVSKLEVGEKLDVRDPNYVWKVATIKRLKVSQDLQRTRFLIIHYDGWSEKNDEEIPETSPRFSALGFYTNRSDIPKYNKGCKNPFLKNLLIVNSFEDKLKGESKLLYIKDDETSSSE